MKKFAIAGMLLFLALLLVTCEMPDFGELGDNARYTDVVYSEDGSQVTIYLDGKGVPETRAMRSLTNKMAEMAYDYLEVVFHYHPASGADYIARSAWQLGQTAGISGVFREGAGVDYGNIRAPSASTAQGTAVLMVGRYSDKTLFGVGKLTHVDGSSSSQVITSSTNSITFSVKATLAVLADYSKAAGSQHSEAFLTASGASSSANMALPAQVTTTNTSGRITVMEGVRYPLYLLTENVEKIFATYTFGGWATDTLYNAGVFILNDGAIYRPQIKPRDPRIVRASVLYYPDVTIDRVTNVAFDTTTTANMITGVSFGTVNGAIPATPPAPLSEKTYSGLGVFFDTRNSAGGFLSFNFQIPVYGITRAASTNGGPASTGWYVASGYGSSLYNVDDGVGGGGCVLVGVGEVADVDWIRITTAGDGTHDFGLERW